MKSEKEKEMRRDGWRREGESLAERGRRKVATKGKRGKAKGGKWERTQDSSSRGRRQSRDTRQREGED